MEAIDIFGVLRRHLWVILALAILTTIAGYGISFIKVLIPEKYDASAIVMVRPHDQVSIDTQIPNKEFLGFPVAQTPVVEAASKTYIQIIQSPALLSEVVRELKLDQKEKTETDGTLLGRMSAAIKDFYDDYVADAIARFKYGRVVREDPFTKAVEDVTKGLELKSYEDTYVFGIKYSGGSPQAAADVANTTARLFIQFLEKLRSAEAKDAAEKLKTDVDESRQRLEAAREALRGYKESHHVFLYQSEYDAKLKVISDLSVELAKLDDSMAARGGGQAGTYAKERARLAQSIGGLRAELAPLPMVERELQLRQSDVDVADTAYQTVAKELRDAEIKSDPMPEARLISLAFVSELPTKPRRITIVGVALLSGLLAGVTLAFFLEYLDRTVRGLKDIEDFVGLKVIATIPRVPRRSVALLNYLARQGEIAWRLRSARSDDTRVRATESQEAMVDGRK
jgi:uncharacterized protein involved in exopolysaccharide biosynthesis